MPNFDGSGPLGQGAMTGRRRGRCRDIQMEKSKEQSVENKNNIYGVGRGGRHFGGGKGNCFGGGNGRERGRQFINR